MVIYMNKTKLYGISFLLAIALFIAACGEKSGNKDDKKAELEKLKKLQSETAEKIKTLEAELGENNFEVVEVLVKAIEIQPATFNRHINIQGRVESEKLAMLSSTVGGKIIKINVSEGSYVKRGTIILETESDLMEKSLAELQNSYEFVNKLFQKQSNLWQQKAISEIQYLEAKNNKESLELKIETIKRQLKETRVVAPFDGTVERIFPKIGEMAVPGMSLVQIAGGGALKVVANVSESYIGTFKPGIPALIDFVELNEKVESKVSVVSKAIDNRSRTFRVELQNNKIPNAARPNMLCSITFTDVSIPNSMIVPLSALQKTEEGYYLYVIEGNDKLVAKKRIVTVDKVAEDSALISSGLNMNDKVITEGVLDVADGQVIKIKN